MNNRTRLLLVAALLPVVAAVMISSQRAGAKRNTIDLPSSRPQDRLMVKKADFDPPVKITLVRTKGGLVETDKSFSDDDDWLRGLTIKVLNDSGKTVTYIGMQLSFRRTEDQEKGLPAGWPIDYGLDPFRYENRESIPTPQEVRVLSGSTVEIALSEGEYDEIKSFLRDVGFPSSVKKAELRVIKVGFSDGTAWNSGRVYTRDPSGPRKWRPIDEPQVENPPDRQPQSRATSSSAFFLKTAFGDYDRKALSSPEHLTAQPLLLPTAECGRALLANVSCNNPNFDCRYDLAELYPNPNPTQAISAGILCRPE